MRADERVYCLIACAKIFGINGHLFLLNIYLTVSLNHGDFYMLDGSPSTSRSALIQDWIASTRTNSSRARNLSISSLPTVSISGFLNCRIMSSSLKIDTGLYAHLIARAINCNSSNTITEFSPVGFI